MTLNDAKYPKNTDHFDKIGSHYLALNYKQRTCTSCRIHVLQTSLRILRLVRYGHLFFVFRQKIYPCQVFSTISSSFSTFSPSRKLFCQRKKYSNSRWRRRDSNGPKIVQTCAKKWHFRSNRKC